MNYYVSDLHLGHRNVLWLSKRPFASIEEMDKALIDNWNSRVKDTDDVYILGDVCYRCNNPMHYLSKLKGRKHLVIGNHDGAILKKQVCRDQFVEIDKQLTVRDGDTTIFLFHYPVVEWDGFYHGTIHFYGHIHNNYENATSKMAMSIPNAYNVGVDVLDYFPRTKDEIINHSF